jgi:glycogen debranching enzyme
MNEPLSLQDAIRIEDRWYVLATSSRTGDPTRVLKHGESFALFDQFGDAPMIGTGEHGIYHQGTRFLSHFELRLNEKRPVLLHSTVRQDNSLLAVDMTTQDCYESGELTILKGTVHVSRSRLLWDASAHERMRVTNYGERRVELRITIEFSADYADIFEVRGFTRERRGRDLPPEVTADSVRLGYVGLDGAARRTQLTWSPAPARISGERVDYDLSLAPKGQFEIEARIDCDPNLAASAMDFDRAYVSTEAGLHSTHSRRALAVTGNEQFNFWLERSAADLAMLTAGNPEGAYPYAGVPWYSVPFGRDGILTALHYLWVDPSMARGVLAFLAKTQATEERPEQDAEPGKIVHEMRKGELANLGEIPFGRYYGTIDATPLFIVLAGEYYQRTGDMAFLRELWPHVERALRWIDDYGDADGDGFVEYRRKSGTGLANQGWKDSEDAVFHASGELAHGSIALCEVQGYVYLAKMHAARLALSLDKLEMAEALQDQALRLAERFEQAFWCEELETYALALDGEKRPCQVRSSNAGQVLWTGIAEPERAARVARTLLSPDSFCGWGVRTIAEGEARYNPMSYHNGSVWPHDNAMIAMGLARYGMKDKTAAIATALFDASLFMDLHRLPELYCGFVRRPGEGPTLYPVACSPQAWASSSAFYVLKACLGLSFRPEEPRIRSLHPFLPKGLRRVELRNLRVGHAAVDIHFEQFGTDVSVNVVRKEGEVDVSVVL